MICEMITAETLDGVTYYSATRRGVEYMAFDSMSGWGVSTRRLALGRMNVGGFKYYSGPAEISEKVKAFAGLALLLSAEAMQ